MLTKDALFTMLVLQEQANYLEVVFLNPLVGVVLEHQESVNIVTKFWLVEDLEDLKVVDLKTTIQKGDQTTVMTSVHMNASLKAGVGRRM